MRRLNRYVWSSVLAAALAACGGGGGGSATGASGGSSLGSLSGVAAVGAAISGGTVTARCVAGPDLTGTTDSNGAFNLVLTAAHTAPCMLKVVGGSPSVTLHSFATAAGQVNISPITDLVVTKALGSDPASAFNSFNGTQGDSIAGNLATAKAYVQTQITNITGSGTADPLTSPFTVGSADDKVLDALGAAMAAANGGGGKTIADLRSAITAAPATSVDLKQTVPAYLGAPTGVTAAANGASQITVNWSAVPGATGYNVYTSTTSSVTTSSTKLTASPVATAGGYVASNLTAATQYYFIVTAVNSVVSESAASAAVNDTTSAASVTAAPTGVTATVNSGTQITVNWSGVSGATGYNVYRSGTSGGTRTKLTLTPITNAVAYTDTGLTASTAYFYTVTAVNASGESAASSEATGTTSAASATLTISTMANTSGPVSSGKVGDQFYVIGSGFERSSFSATFTGNVAGTVFFLNDSQFTLTIPNGAQTGPITFKNLTSGATVTSAPFTITTAPVIPASCSALGVVKTLPATGVVGVDWSDCRDQSPGDVQVVWGGGQFVSAGKGVLSSVIKTSTNGYTWTALPSGKNFSRIAFNGTRWIGFIADSLTVQISYTADATLDTWTNVPINLRNPGTLQYAFAANGRFFVSTNNNTLLSSADGINWTETPNGSVVAPSKIIWQNSRYLTYGGTATSYQQQYAYSSIDGENWTSTFLTFSPINNGGGGRTGIPLVSYSFIPKAFAWNGSKFVNLNWSSGLNGSDVWSSTDGIAWTKDASNLAPFQVNVKDLIWTGTRFVALGAGLTSINTNIADTIASSTDGASWSAATISGMTGYAMNPMAYSSTLDRLLVTGYINSSRNALFVSP